MYHIANTVLVQDSVDSDTNKKAIVNVFEEFIGCAVSSWIASLTYTFELFTLLLIIMILAVFQKSNSKGFDREDSQQGDQSFVEHEPV
jgi:hypothetical protein